MEFPEPFGRVAETFNSTPEDESPLAFCHLNSEETLMETKLFRAQSEEQQKEARRNRHIRSCSPETQQTGQRVPNPESSDITLKANHSNPLQSSWPPEWPNDAEFRQSRSTAPPRRSNTSNLSNYSQTVKGRPYTSKAIADDVSNFECGKSSANNDKGSAGLASAMEHYLGDTDAIAQDNPCLPFSIRSTPSWSVLTESPEPSTETLAEVTEEDVIHYRTPSPPRASHRTAPPPRTPEPEAKVQRRRLSNRRSRKPRAATRWSPVAPWSPNRKASFHYSMQQLIASTTRGTDINSGLFEVNSDYFDF